MVLVPWSSRSILGTKESRVIWPLVQLRSLTQACGVAAAACAVAVCLLAAPVRADTPTPADLAAARTYIETMSEADQAAIRACAATLDSTPELVLLMSVASNTLGGNLSEPGEGAGTGTGQSATAESFTCPTQEGPAASRTFLKIETGGHTNRIRGLVFSPEGDRLYSGSDDKTIRVWDIESQSVVETIRGHIWEGEGGQIYALAISPDGQMLAAAGNMGPPAPTADKRCGDPSCGNVRLFQSVDGRWTSVKLLQGHTNTVLALAFSRDGKSLASASVDKTIRLWNVATLTETSKFSVPEVRAQALAFLPDNRHLAFVSGPKGPRAVQILGLDENRIVRTLTARRTAAVVAVSDDGSLLAAGGDDGHPEVWRLATGEHLHTLDLPGDVSGLAFGHGATAAMLVAVTEKAPFPQVAWNAETGQRLGEWAIHDNAVHAVAFSPDGARVATSGGTDWSVRLWEPRTAAREDAKVLRGKGRTVYSVGFVEETDREQQQPDLLSGVQAPPGQRVLSLAWGHKDPCPEMSSCPDRQGDLEFVMQIPRTASERLEGLDEWPRDEVGLQRRTDPVTSRARLTAGPGTLARAAGARLDEYPSLVLEGAGGRRTILTRAKNRSSDHISYSFNHAGTLIASGGRNGVLDLIAPDGTGRKALTGHESNIWGVAFDAADRLLVTGASDQTVRLWNGTTGELVVSLLHAGGSDWVMWTPQGYFAASPGGERAIGWHINHGPGKVAEFVDLQQLRKHFYRPGVVERAIQLASAEAAVREARAAGKILVLTAEDLVQQPLPKFVIYEPANRAKAATGTIQLKLRMPPESGEITEFDIDVGGTKVESSLASGKRRALASGALAGWEIDVPLRKGDNIITVIGRGKNGLTHSETVRVTLDRDGTLDSKGTLYIVAIGVDKYPNLRTCQQSGGSCDLRFAGRDAEEFARTLGERMGVGKGHDKVVSLVLTNNAADGRLQPVKANIEHSLSQLALAGANDTVVLYVAGHGHGGFVGEDYRFLTTDAEKGAAGGWLESSVVAWTEFQRALDAARGRKLLFVDTCRSAGALGASLINDAVTGGAAVYFASGKQQDALERKEFGGGHGAFTYALIEGLTGAAKFNDEPTVTTKGLAFYVLNRVRKLTERRQEPRDVILEDFELVKLAP